VSERSAPGADLFHFNWHGAPQRWGSYHPSVGALTQPGSMRRWVYRSIDLRSRYNELTQEHVDACFREAAEAGQPRVLSYFSHDNRDMRAETYHAVELLRRAAERTGVPWRSCTAVEAHRRYHGLDPRPISLRVRADREGVAIETDAEPFQPVPFVAAELADGRFTRLYPSPDGPLSWRLGVDLARVARLAAAVTSDDGTVTVWRDGPG
jgi:hypothetical protein